MRITAPKPRYRAALAGIVAAALALTACAPSEEAGPKQSVLTVANPMSVASIDPHGPGSGDRPTITVAQHVFDSLVVRDGSEFVPSLAASWTNDDPNVWRVELVEGAVFHDGSPVTAADVVASYERLIELKGPLASTWAAVESVVADGDRTVVFTTTTPLGTFLSNLALLYIAPAALMNEPDFFLKPIGSGPFVVESFTPGDRTVLVKNEDYWGEKAQVDKLVIREIPEVSSLIAALETGEVDLTWGIAPDQLPNLLSNSDVTVESMPSFQYFMNWFNSSREPFTNPEVRRALWHAVDVQSLVEDLFPEAANVASAPIPSTVFGWSEQAEYEYNPELARKLLADAGYPNGFDAGLDLSVGGGPQIRLIAQTMISDWAEVGVNVELKEKERAVWLEDLLALNWDMNLLINSVLTGDADFTLGRLYPSAANRTGYANAELDEILAAAKQTVDQAERQKLYDRANQIIWDDAVGIFPMELLANYAWRDRVVGFTPDANETPRFTSVTVE